MRYAIVTETWPPEINGVALTVHALAEGLQARGHDIAIARPRQASDGDATDGPGTRLLRSLPLPRYPGLRVGMPATGTLRADWSAWRPDAVYVATEGPLGWSALRAARRLGLPVATGFHTRFDAYMRNYGAPLLEPVAMRWMRRFHNAADATLVPTWELLGFLMAHGFRNVMRLPRAVDPHAFAPRYRDASLRSSWGADPVAPVAMHVGRIAAEKNLALAVRAFRALQRVQPRARMVFVGDGPERAALAREHPDFVFCGTQRGDALARHFASADLFVFPSRSETFGNVTLEALASGVPTVAFDYGAAREHLVDGRHGAAIADGDEEAFVRAVVRIGGDAGLRMRMADATAAAVAGLHPSQVAAEFDAILQSLANRRDIDAHHAAA